MDKKEITETVLRNCYKNAQMALCSLDDVIDKTEGELKNELVSQKKGYEKHIDEVNSTALKHEIKLSDITNFKKTMLSTAIEMKTLKDDSHSHIAEMTLKGTIMGITELLKDISEYSSLLDSDVLTCITKLKDFEEQCEKNLKNYL